MSCVPSVILWALLAGATSGEREVSLRLVVEPALDSQGRLWRVDLRSGTSEGFSGFATSEGTLEKHGLTPGPYSLRISGKDRSIWLKQEVELKAGDPDLRVRVPVVQVRGRILLGDEPLRSTLWFEALEGPGRVRFDSDDEGRFGGGLPKTGLWQVDWVVEERGLPLKATLGPVEVWVPDGKAYASVEIRVPGTRLSGVVVDEANRPLPGAAVTLTLPPWWGARVFADENGDFEARGVPPGEVEVQAEEGDRSSGWLPVHLEEGGESAGLRLVARRQLEIRGRVSSAGAPVAGARIWATLDFGQPNLLGEKEAVIPPESSI